jgi:hypothetical protein
MDIDLYRDWIAHLRSELSAYGYETAQLRSAEAVAHTFLNLTKRLVKSIPRAVLKTKTFSCPNELLPGLALVEQKVAAGEDLSPHLSKLLRDPSFNDPLLNDWGIHHVHLGATLDSDGFASRTGHILFARFDNSNAYFIDVLPHGSWSLQRLIKDLHDNWPDSIKRFSLNGAIHSGTPISDKDKETLRKKNVNTMANTGGDMVYAPIGGGFMTSGISMQVVIQSVRYAARLRQMQKTIIDNINSIAAEAKEKGLNFPDNPRFELQIDEDDNFYAAEVNCMLAVPFGKL